MLLAPGLSAADVSMEDDTIIVLEDDDTPLEIDARIALPPAASEKARARSQKGLERANEANEANEAEGIKGEHGRALGREGVGQEQQQPEQDRGRSAELQEKKTQDARDRGRSEEAHERRDERADAREKNREHKGRP
jgi:hypothetical protein